MFPAHHVARVGAADRVVRAGGVYAEGFYPLFDDPITTRFVESRVLAGVFGGASVTVVGPRVQEQYVASRYRQTGAGYRTVEVRAGDVGLGLLVRDVYTNGASVEEAQVHFVYGGCVLARVKMAYGVDVG